jgi:hypothetical protein
MATIYSSSRSSASVRVGAVRGDNILHLYGGFMIDMGPQEGSVLRLVPVLLNLMLDKVVVVSFFVAW